MKLKEILEESMILKKVPVVNKGDGTRYVEVEMLDKEVLLERLEEYEREKSGKYVISLADENQSNTWKSSK